MHQIDIFYDCVNLSTSPVVHFEMTHSNTNGHARQTTTEGRVPEAACAIKKSVRSPDDGPIGPKHVEIDKKPRL
jgi:hypothetical protein